MAMPASNGKLCTKLSDMSIGDYIRCEYVAPTAGVAGTFQNLGGESSLTELPVAPATTANGYFYFLKADKGLLIADRKVQNAISWSKLNENGLITGSIKKLQNCLIRILTQHEFNGYISNSNLNGSITTHDTLVWGSENSTEWLQDNKNGVAKTAFFLDGHTADSGSHYLHNSNGWLVGPAILVSKTTDRNVEVSCSYRPVTEFIDNPKSTNIWY